MKSEKEETRKCANEGCGRPAQAEDGLCDVCGIEWSLFRRDTRFGERAAPRREGG